MERILMTVLSLTLSGSALGLIVLLASRLFKKRLSSGFVYLCWVLVVLRFALPVSGLIGLSAQEPGQRASGAENRAEGAGFYSYYSRTEGLLTLEDANKLSRKAAENGQDAVETPDAQTGSAASGRPAQQGLPFYRDVRFWFALWLAGALCSFGGTLVSFGRFRRLLFRTLKPAHPLDSSVLGALNASPYPALYRSDKVSSSLLLGLIRPVIVLPDRDYSAEDLDRVLRHELTHYRRGDLALKWLQALVYALHWFNPLIYLFRAQTTLFCELSCDQRLLRRMDRSDKQSYGELLLKLAAERALPRRVIAVSFTTQKRDLKERLVQIMNFNKLGKHALALGLALVMMVAGCGFAFGPARASDAQGSGADNIEIETVRVSDVNGLIAAIGSNRTILLAPGTYDLSTSAAYGHMTGTAYYWEQNYDGYTLVLDAVSNLTLQGEGEADEVRIVTSPRSAAVLSLLGCKGVNFKNLTAGHTVLPDACQGPVLSLYASIDISVDNCVLFGCGTVGLVANECWKLKTTNTVIKECTYGAVQIMSSFDTVFDGCEFRDCEAHAGYPGGCLIEVYSSTDVGVYNTRIHGNHTNSFVDSVSANGFEIMGCQITDNRFQTGFFQDEDSVTVAQCSFDQNTLDAKNFFEGSPNYALDPQGARLDAAALLAMDWAQYDVPAPAEANSVQPEGKLLPDGRMEFHAKDADELISALGSDRIIYLDGEEYLLSSAAQYGKNNGENCFWTHNYDGYELVLIGVNNLTIAAPNGKVHIETLPRSADVLAFKFCKGITLENLVVGHVTGAGSCMGDVISFLGCEGCEANRCELFGCGVNGVNGYASVDLHVNDTLIYECSSFAAVISDCKGTQFNNVTFRDCGYNTIETQRCSVLFSGTTYYTDGYQPASYDDYYDGYYDDYSAIDPEDYGFQLPDIAPEAVE